LRRTDPAAAIPDTPRDRAAADRRLDQEDAAVTIWRVVFVALGSGQNPPEEIVPACPVGYTKVVARK